MSNTHLHPIFRQLMPIIPDELEQRHKIRQEILRLRKELEAAHYDVWLENHMSAAHKLDTIARELRELAGKIRENNL